MNSKTRRNLMILVCILLLLLLFAVGGLIVATMMEDDGQGGGMSLDTNAGKIKDTMEETRSTSQGVTIPGWSTITIPANTTDVTMNFTNPEKNAGLYYLTFELRLMNGEDFEVLYTSELVEPGMQIQKVQLARGLPEGEYDCVIHVQPYRMDEEQTPTNNADMKAKLIVR